MPEAVNRTSELSVHVILIVFPTSIISSLSVLREESISFDMMISQTFSLVSTILTHPLQIFVISQISLHCSGFSQLT